MCGIAGYFGKKSISENVIVSTLAFMKQRGPDVQQYKTFFENNFSVSLLHSRLSIIDLEERSNQPFTIGDATIIFNGEIYNYLELKEKLLKRNIKLKTTSDTEILLHYYLIFGEKCVEYFEGMWAFAIYDSKGKTLFLSRDRFAEKPLYYYENNNGFYFASETKFLKSLSEIKISTNENHLLRYLVNGHKSLYKVNETFYQDVFELPFATNLSIDSTLAKKQTVYWKPKSVEQKITLQDAIEGSRERLIQSVKLRLRSDVPLAFCLSGGVDSSALVSIAAKKFNYNVATFSIIDEDKRYDEEDLIQATIEDVGCISTKIKLSPSENNLHRLKELIKYHDAPVATISYFIHSLLSEAISKNGYRIAISGTGADEIFTGYYDHHNLHLYEMKNHSQYEKYLSDWKKYPAQFVRHPYFQKPDLYFDNPEIREHIYLNNREFSSMLNKDFLESFTEEKYSDSLLRNRMMNELFHEVVRVILHEDDLNSMKYSIENRSPFLDKDLFEFAYSIPNEYLIKDGYAKYILREAVNGILNDKVRLAREKKGFNADIKSIIDFENKNTREFLLEDSPVYRIVNKQKIETSFSMKQFPNSYKKFLFNFVNVKMFLEE